jgi:hypothetical protein
VDLGVGGSSPLAHPSICLKTGITRTDVGANSLLQESDEPRLFEVMVTGKGFGNAVLPHYHEGNAIGQGPFFVRPFRIQLKPVEKRRIIERDNPRSCTCEQLLSQVEKLLPTTRR